MQARNADAFALKNSGVEAFLYADVGAELNGSMLTVLSMLARLGRDPWAEAARWAVLPKGAVVDSLVEAITQMPLAFPALAATRSTAMRLAQLLPAKTPTVGQGRAAGTGVLSGAPRWLPMTLLYGAMAVGLALSALSNPGQSAPRPGPAIAAASAPVAAVSRDKAPPAGR